MVLVAGVDVGSTQAKGVVLDGNGHIVGRALVDMEQNMSTAAAEVFERALADAGALRSDISRTVATGYGRYRVEFGDAQVTEIGCHARGAVAVFPGTRTVLDIGGQDTKAIRSTDSGEVETFAMNDKCAAGTGRFLGACSLALEVPLSELGALAMCSTAPVAISTTCTVFAESEIIGHIAKGRSAEDVVMGMHYSVAKRCASLVRRVGLVPEVTFTGGVSRNKAMVLLLQEILGTELHVSPDSQHMGALGAALFALDQLHPSRPGQPPVPAPTRT